LIKKKDLIWSHTNEFHKHSMTVEYCTRTRVRFWSARSYIGRTAPGGTSRGGIFWWSYCLLYLSFIAYCSKQLIFIDLSDIFICFCPYRCLPPPLHIDLPKKWRKNSILAHLRGLFSTEGLKW